MGSVMCIRDRLVTSHELNVKKVVITEIHTDTLCVQLPSDTVFLVTVRCISKPIHDTIYVNRQGDLIANYGRELFVDSTVKVL